MLDVVAFDDVGFAEALANVFDRAFHGVPTLCVPVIPDRRSAVALAAVAEIVATHSTYGKRRECLERVRERGYVVDGRTQADAEALTKKERDSLRDVWLASDSVIVRSWAELVRLSALLDHRPIRSLRAVAPPRVAVPAVRPAQSGTTILVWAPGLEARQAAMFALALEELKATVVIACARTQGSDALGLRATFVGCDAGAPLAASLDRVAAIVAADPDDPADAIALAQAGLPVAASFNSGAYEYVDGLHSYDTWDFRSILNAALAALGGEAPRLRGAVPRPQDIVDDPPPLGPPAVSDPPLVSVIVPTLNRHGVLPRAIESIARQTYPNVETLVVNDGGRPVDDIVRVLERVHVVDHPEPKILANLHRWPSMMLDRIAGDYLVLLSDDDYLFPTHISRLVYALERTGAAVAAGLCSESFLQRGTNDYYDLIGHAIRLYRATDPTALRTIPASLAITAMVMRRDAVAAIGDFNPAVGIYSDYEWHLRFLERYDFVWVPYLVTNMDVRLDNSSWSGQSTSNDRCTDLAGVWSRDDVADRPDIAAARQRLLDLYRRDAPSPEHPLHRGVTRLAEPRPNQYRLE